ncbi:transporter substrate-binding domain-containing protein [Arenibacterium sp. CAU 1754]
MNRLICHVLAVLLFAVPFAGSAVAQNEPLTFATIERPPFAFREKGELTGFTIDVMRAVADNLGREINFTMTESFPEMLGAVMAGEVDGAAANISITADREAEMDFSLPIYESGLQIMVPMDEGGSSLMRALFDRELLILFVAAFAMLFGAGMLMWLFERHKQPYFDRPVDDAMFPAFWWALNLVVNGGFEERMPRSIPGRLLSVTMVISSLFLLSVFVAHITASLTVEAISGSIQNISDLDGRRVATTSGSTANAYLEKREIGHTTYDRLDQLLAAIADGELDAVVFDGPILSHYAATEGLGKVRLLERVFRPEDYGIALAAGSPLREQINRSLLSLRESGAYADITQRWFGQRN